MGAEPYQVEMGGVGLAVNQHEVGADMAIAVILPRTRQGVVPLARIERPVGGQFGNDPLQLRVQRFAEPASFLGL